MTEASVQPKKFQWTFDEMRRNPCCTEDPSSPDALYSWSLDTPGPGRRMGSSCSFRDAQVMMRALGVTEPAQLEGKTFESEVGDACGAFNMLLTTTRWRETYGTDYVPPDAEELFDRAAAALAFLQWPEYSDVDRETVLTAFAETFPDSQIDPEWLEAFQRKLSFHSGGKTRLEPASHEAFRIRIRGRAAYFTLIRGDCKRRLIIGPYARPFTFDADF